MPSSSGKLQGFFCRTSKVSFLILSYFILSYFILYYIILYYIILYYIILYYIILYYIILPYLVQNSKCLLSKSLECVSAGGGMLVLRLGA